MNLQDRQSIEEACRSLVHRLTYMVDHHRAQDATRLFREDATWLRGGKLYTGHDEILSSFVGTEALIIRHYVSTITVDVRSPTSAAAVTYFALYRSPDGTDACRLPMPLPPLFSMGEWEDEFLCENDEWRFSRRVVNRLFQAA